MSLGELLRVCPRALRLWSHDVPHDRWYPVVAVSLGRAILTGYLEDTLTFSKVRSLALSDGAIRTRSGLGVGSTYGQLKRAYGKGELNGGAEECSTVEVTFPALPGEFFDLDYASQCKDPGEAAVWNARVRRVYLEPPSPVELAGRPNAGPAFVSDSVFLATTSAAWPHASAAFETARIPWEASAIPRCGSRTPAITGDSLGPLAIGETLDQLRERCPRVLYVWLLQGRGEPAVALKVGDSRAVARMYDTLPSSRVRLIDISDSMARTPDGVGVGTTVRDLVAVHRDLAMISSEGSCILFFRQSLQGLIFLVPPDACTRHPTTGERVKAQDLFPPDTKIVRIWIKGSR